MELFSRTFPVWSKRAINKSILVWVNLLCRLFPEKDNLIVLDLDLEFRAGINQVRLSPWMQNMSNSSLAEEIFSGASCLFDDVAYSGGLFNSPFFYPSLFNMRHAGDNHFEHNAQSPGNPLSRVIDQFSSQIAWFTLVHNYTIFFYYIISYFYYIVWMWNMIERDPSVNDGDHLVGQQLNLPYSVRLTPSSNTT